MFLSEIAEDCARETLQMTRNKLDVVGVANVADSAALVVRRVRDDYYLELF
jgi:hypothetical protein